MIIPIIAILLAGQAANEAPLPPDTKQALDISLVRLQAWMSCSTTLSKPWLKENETALDIARVAAQSCSEQKADYRNSIRTMLATIGGPASSQAAIDRKVEDGEELVRARVAEFVLNSRAAKGP